MYVYSSKRETSHWFSKFNNKQPKIKMSWEGGSLCTCLKRYLLLELIWHMYTSIGNRFETCTSIGVGKLSVSVVTTTNPDDSLTMAQQGSNETLHNTSWNVLQRRETLWKCQVVGSSGAHADPVHPVYVFLGFKSGERAGRGNVWTLWQKLLPNTCNMCGLALSCWNIPPLTFMCGMIWCCRISFQYLKPDSALATWTRGAYEQESSMNKSRPWTRGVHEQESSVNKRRPWTRGVHEQESSVNKRRPWTRVFHEQESSMNRSRPWTRVVHEQESSMNKSRPWTRGVHEQESSVNKCRPWTRGVHEQESSMNRSRPWTRVVHEQESSMNNDAFPVQTITLSPPKRSTCWPQPGA